MKRGTGRLLAQIIEHSGIGHLGVYGIKEEYNSNKSNDRVGESDKDIIVLGQRLGGI